MPLSKGFIRHPVPTMLGKGISNLVQNNHSYDLTITIKLGYMFSKVIPVFEENTERCEIHTVCEYKVQASGSSN